MKTFPPRRRMPLRALSRPLFSTTLTLIFYLAGCPGGYAQLTVEQDGATANFTLGVASLDHREGEDEHPYYLPFWIFGDGEYYPRLLRRDPSDPDRVRFCWENHIQEYDSPILHFYEYFFTSSDDDPFIPIVVALPRKGDPPPPGLALSPSFFPQRLSGDGGLSVTTPGSGIQLREIQPGRRIYLAHSHGYLNYHANGGGERSVFVISYKPPACISQTDTGRIYLLIGAVRSSPGTAPTLDDEPHLWFGDTPSNLYDPFYYPGQADDFNRSVSPAAPSPFSSQLVYSFNHDYIRQVQLARNPVAPDRFEFRLFQEVQFENPSPALGESRLPELGANDWSYAITILTSTSLCSLTNDAILPFLQGLPGVNALGGGLYTYNSEYIIDADTMYLKSGEPHDPNRLYVTRYCDSLLTASLTLDFCNSPFATAVAPGAEISFRIIDSNFTWCRLNGIRDQDGTSVNWETCKGPCIKRYLFPGSNYYNCGNRSIYYNDLDLPAEECASIDVVIKAIADTISRPGGLRYHFLDYLKHYQVLEASVTFEGAGGTTITRKNERLNSPAIWRIKNEDLTPQECVLCEGPCFFWWHFIIPSILVVALIGFFWRRWRILRARNQA